MATLDNRSIALKTPFGKDVLLPRFVAGGERLSETFRYDLQLFSEKGDLNLDAILGKELTLTYNLPTGGGQRHVHGIVTEFAQRGFERRFHHYHAVIRPWFWLLTRTGDCRIFQQKSVPDIFEEVVKRYGFTDYQLKLKGHYPQRDYCVQYRETDFAFISRLLAEEGIYYFFAHQESSHQMVLADDGSAHSTVPGYEEVPYFPPDAPNAQRERDHISEWAVTKSVHTGVYATTDFDFENPRQSLLRSESIARQHAYADFEVFDYPASLAAFSGGEAERIAKARIQALQANYALMHGQGNAVGLATGFRFKLAQYPRKDLNMEYLIIASDISIAADDYDTGQQSGAIEFSVSLNVIDARTVFRPVCSITKPVIHGSQTAMVVGPGGEEIYTDEYGRVKVQFHWDRYGELNENSSCWVRVAQVWAGKGWGALHIPRVGQEVIVSFLEGDPDRPIITGSVYNGDAKPPYDLPGNKTQSGIKSRSSSGGAAANCNELRFEDKKGDEHILLHAEKDHGVEVEHDETHWVGNDRTCKVDNDETITIKRDRFMTIERDRFEKIQRNKSEQVLGNKKLEIAKDHEESIGGSMNVMVSKNLSEIVAINYSETVGAAMELTVGGAMAVSVGGGISEAVGGVKAETVGGAKTESVGVNKTVDVGAHLSETVGKNYELTVGKDQTEKAQGKRRIEVSKEFSLQAKKVEITAEDEITFKAGSAEVTLKKNGDITLKGKKISIKGSGDVVIKGSKVLGN